MGSPSSIKGGGTCIDTPNITSPIEDDPYPDAYGLRRPRSQSLDSGAPLVPPPLSSALIAGELSSGLCSCNCGGNCGGHSHCLGQKGGGGGVNGCNSRKSPCCTCGTCCIQPSSGPIVPFLTGGGDVKPILTSQQSFTQSVGSGASIVFIGPAANSRKMQRNHYHSRKYE